MKYSLWTNKWTATLIGFFAFGLLGCVSGPSAESAMNSQSSPSPNANAVPNLSKEYEGITVGQFLFAVETRRDVPFPCALELSTISLNNNGLEKIREKWISSEDDNRYRLATMSRGSNGQPGLNCVCPGLCVIVVNDQQSPAPDNYAVLILGDRHPESGFVLAAKNLDLSRARLGWHSSTPFLEFLGNQGQQTDFCDIKSIDNSYSCKFIAGPRSDDLFSKH